MTLKTQTTKAFTKFASILTATSALSCIPAIGCATEFMLKPSFGIDVGVRSMQFQELYGKDHFASHYNHISPYMSLQILEHLGVQAGFETSDTRKVVQSYSDTQPWLGVNSGIDTKFSSSSKISGEFIGISANTDTFWQESIPTKLSLFAGIVMLKCKMSHTELADMQRGNAIETTETMNSNKKAIPKISVAANFFIPKINGLSFKINYGFEKTSHLTATKITDVTLPPLLGKKSLLVKLKDSYYTSIGISYEL